MTSAFRTLTLATLLGVAGSFFGSVPTASAEIIDEPATGYIRINRTGIAATLLGIGYYNEEEERFVLLDGNEVVNTHYQLEYTPDEGVDIADLEISVVMNIQDAEESYIFITGDQLTETATAGTFEYNLDTDLHNGLILPGIVQVQVVSVDENGFFTGSGEWTEGSGFYFDVVPVPEPGTSLAALGATALLLRRRR